MTQKQTHLLFQIAAPLMSFGSSGAKQERASDSHPSKGFALGFLGAALGKKREDPWHDESSALGFAVLTVKPGVRVEDYHTVATPRGDTSYRTRREEAEASDYTVETWREYLSDGYFILAFWGEGTDLDEAREALVRPTFELFAGRKSCPLSLPPAPMTVTCDTLAYAFYCYGATLYPALRPENKPLVVHWEAHPESGLEAERSYRRKDQVLNRAKRLYCERVEYEGELTLPVPVHLEK